MIDLQALLSETLAELDLMAMLAQAQAATAPPVQKPKRQQKRQQKRHAAQLTTAGAVLDDLQQRLRDTVPGLRVTVSWSYSSLTKKRHGRVTFFRLREGEKPPSGIIENAPGLRFSIDASGPWFQDEQLPPEGKITVELAQSYGALREWKVNSPSFRKWNSTRIGLDGLRQAADRLVAWFQANAPLLIGPPPPKVTPAHLRYLARLWIQSAKYGTDLAKYGTELCRAYEEAPRLLNDVRDLGWWHLSSPSQGNITEQGIEALRAAGLTEERPTYPGSSRSAHVLTQQARNAASEPVADRSAQQQRKAPVLASTAQQIKAAKQAAQRQKQKQKAQRQARQAQIARVSVASPGEISSRAAVEAFSGTSFVPERRAESARSEYAETLNELYRKLSKLAKTDEQRAVLDEEFPSIKADYKVAYNAWLGARSRTTSWMITGRSGRNESRQRKKMQTEMRRMDDMNEVLAKAEARIVKRLKEARLQTRGGVIGDLEARLRDREAQQEHMKAVNKIIGRKVKLTANQQAQPAEAREALVRVRQAHALVEELGLSMTKAMELVKGDFMGRTGYPSYALTNNNKEIHRLRERLAEQTTKQQRAKKAETLTEEALVYPFEGSAEYPYPGKVEYDYGERRLRLSFDVRIPREAFQNIRRTTGFNWSRLHEAFSAILGTRAVNTARQITGRSDLPYPDDLEAT